MTATVGNLDRLVRIVLGLVLILTPYISNAAIFDVVALKYGATIIGAVLLVTALTRICPLYSILGIKTCKAS